MNYATALPLSLQSSAPWLRECLPPLQPVRTLRIPPGQTAVLEAENGRIWVTCDGRPEDLFLQAGQRLSFTGPARLRVSAQGSEAARLRWARVSAA